MTLQEFLQQMESDRTKAEQFSSNIEVAGRMMTAAGLSIDAQGALLSGDVARVHDVLQTESGSISQFVLPNKPVHVHDLTVGPRSFRVTVE